MNNNMIRKVTSFEILIHWTLAISFFILTISGFGFLFQAHPFGETHLELIDGAGDVADLILAADAR